MNLSFVILPAILIVIAMIVTIVVFILLRQKRRDVQAYLRGQGFLKRQESAIWASATIVSARGGPVGGEGSGSDRARYKLSLQVTPPGGKPYLVRTTWLVDIAYIESLRPGGTLSVRIDQQDPAVIYPGAGWAKYVA